MKTGMQPAMMVSLRRRVLAESPGMDRQNVAFRIRSMMLLCPVSLTYQHGRGKFPSCLSEQLRWRHHPASARYCTGRGLAYKSGPAHLKGTSQLVPDTGLMEALVIRGLVNIPEGERVAPKLLVGAADIHIWADLPQRY